MLSQTRMHRIIEADSHSDKKTVFSWSDMDLDPDLRLGNVDAYGSYGQNQRNFPVPTLGRHCLLRTCELEMNGVRVARLDFNDGVHWVASELLNCDNNFSNDTHRRNAMSGWGYSIQSAQLSTNASSGAADATGAAETRGALTLQARDTDYTLFLATSDGANAQDAQAVANMFRLRNEADQGVGANLAISYWLPWLQSLIKQNRHLPAADYKLTLFWDNTGLSQTASRNLVNDTNTGTAGNTGKPNIKRPFLIATEIMGLERPKDYEMVYEDVVMQRVFCGGTPTAGNRHIVREPIHAFDDSFVNELRMWNLVTSEGTVPTNGVQFLPPRFRYPAFKNEKLQFRLNNEQFPDAYGIDSPSRALSFTNLAMKSLNIAPDGHVYDAVADSSGNIVSPESASTSHNLNIRAIRVEKLVRKLDLIYERESNATPPGGDANFNLLFAGKVVRRMVVRNGKVQIVG